MLKFDKCRLNGLFMLKLINRPITLNSEDITGCVKINLCSQSYSNHDILILPIKNHNSLLKVVTEN